MKIIVTGGTGFVGSAVVGQCIKDDRISEVVVLSRRAIKETLSKSDKVKVVLLGDFGQYPQDVVEQLQGAEGCIWCLGGKVSDFGGDIETARRVGVDYTLVGAHVFAEHLAPVVGGRGKFSFVFCSGRGAEQDPSKKLWMMKDTRLIKGEVERGLLDLAEERADFDAVILRPGGILASDNVVAMFSKSLFIRLPVLVEALLEVCIRPPTKKILENEEIKYAAVNRSPGG